jgi:hypothetical protein
MFTLQGKCAGRDEDRVSTLNTKGGIGNPYHPVVGAHILLNKVLILLNRISANYATAYASLILFGGVFSFVK